MDFLNYLVNLLMNYMRMDGIVKTIELCLAFWACWIAWRGLKTWREQVIETPKINLAREIMEAFYNMRDLIKRVRVSFISYDPKEVREFFYCNDWTDGQCGFLYRAVLLDRASEQIYAFQKLRNKAKVYYSPEIEKCFLNINQIINNFQRACVEYAKDYEKDDREKVYDKETLKKFLKIMHSSEKDDPINPQIEKILKEVEYNLTPLYETKMFKWKSLKSPTKRGKKKNDK